MSPVANSCFESSSMISGSWNSMFSSAPIASHTSASHSSEAFAIDLRVSRALFAAELPAIPTHFAWASAPSRMANALKDEFKQCPNLVPVSKNLWRSLTSSGHKLKTRNPALFACVKLTILPNDVDSRPSSLRFEALMVSIGLSLLQNPSRWNTFINDRISLSSNFPRIGPECSPRRIRYSSRLNRVSSLKKSRYRWETALLRNLWIASTRGREESFVLLPSVLT
mmetsp:Transcript_5300/g.8016  ORF Transcript_5300/g.8016 Transcript_5300/m.8016 type:complete len:225 (-) Transcript_5300:1119-1793(-)